MSETKTLLRDDERRDKVNEKITLLQKKDGLTFGTDAFLLAAYTEQRRNGVAAELGAGTGIISLLCAARDRFARIYAFEIQEDFAELAERNVIENKLGDKITVVCKDVRDCSAADTGREVDAVFANPPYMRTDSGKRNDSDRKYIARHEVCGDIGDFCRAAFKLLKHGGRFYCVWRPDRLTDLICAMRANRLEPKKMTFVCADSKSEPSMVLVSATKGGASGMRVTAPLLLYKDGTRDMSDEAEKIYDTMSFEI